MNRNCPDSCASCARKAAARAGGSIANSFMAACRNGRKSLFLFAERPGMIDCNWSAVTIRHVHFRIQKGRQRPAPAAFPPSGGLTVLTSVPDDHLGLPQHVDMAQRIASHRDDVGELS